MLKLLLYCTKSKPYLLRDMFCGFLTEKNFEVYDDNEKKEDYFLNGKIVAECDFEVEKIRADYGGNHIGNIEIDDRYDYYVNSLRDEYELCKKSCLTMEELDDYLKGHSGYAIHIKNLNIFDDPRELNFYHTAELDICLLKNAPQNMMYVYDYKGLDEYEKKVLISIKPEWLCKILNKEKTIEIRKKIIKSMIIDK